MFSSHQYQGILSAIVGILCFFLTVCMSTSVEGDYISIKLTIIPESSCPHTEPCLTLQQFSENASQYNDTNTSLTLELYPGDHRLSSPVVIQGISHLKIYSHDAKNVTIIQCSDHDSDLLILQWHS